MKNPINKQNKLSANEIKKAQTEFLAKNITPLCELTEFYVGSSTTTILVRHTMSNPFGFFNGDSTKASYAFYNIPNENIKTSYIQTPEESKRTIEEFIKNTQTTGADELDKSNKSESLLGHLIYCVETDQPCFISENIFLLTTKEKLVSDSVLTQLKSMVQMLNNKPFSQLGMELHEVPGNLVEQSSSLRGSQNQKIFAPYFMLTLHASLNRMDGYFTTMIEDFKKDVFLKSIHKPLSIKMKTKYALGGSIRHLFSFYNRNMTNTNIQNTSNKSMTIECTMLQKSSDKNITQDFINYLQNWHAKILPTAFYKRYEKAKLESELQKLLKPVENFNSNDTNDDNKTNPTLEGGAIKKRAKIKI